ncbi:MAG: hypothetical protein Q9220_002705 [cf. Caloplaca sp. 1 TL-2023]
MSLTFALQSLLARHEAYVFAATEERQRMAASIVSLERDKTELEATNATCIRENRNLLDQLEDLNKTVADTDTHVHSLNATLQSTGNELDRLNVLATRASHLEAQISRMETEHADLHEKLAASEEDQRSAIERWKDAERTIITLQEQVDRIEADARDESERHAEILSRFERREAVDRQLQSAAGRLKGAAAATSLGKEGHANTNVVSHFVKDILADNASLQMGIMELREMLTGSNDEVQNLRQQMLAHQPIYQDQHTNSPPAAPEKNTDQGRITDPDPVPALHVHHHYHEASKIESPMRQSTIPEGPENDPDQSKPESTSNNIFIRNSTLRRSASHESILSIAGIQPKQPRKQHSQIFRGAGLHSRASLGPSSPTTSMVSSKPITITHASSQQQQQQSRAGGRAVSASGAMSTLSSSLSAHNSSAEPSSTTIGKRVGGWVWGKWGVAPMASTGDLRGKATNLQQARREDYRPTGVNQKGSLRALRREKRLESRVEVGEVDEGLLRESLLEEGEG